MTTTDSAEAGAGRERRLAAIMLTDIVGYSRKMSGDEEATLRMLERHNGILMPIIAAHGGRVLKTMGDAILAEFNSVVQAVKCSLAVQSELRAMNEPLPPEQRIEVRIGIHVGDVVVADGDLFGDGVNIAARIQPLAEPGGVCITSMVHSQIKNMPEFMSISLGKKHLKNIPEAVEVLRIQPSSRGAFRRTTGGKLRFLLIAVAVAVSAAGLWLLLRGRPAPVLSAPKPAAEAWLTRSAASIISEAGKRSERVAALSAQGKPAQAVAELEGALDLFPELPETAWTPGEVARATPIFEKWSAYLEKVVRQEPELYAARRVQGKLLFRLGDGELAFSTLDAACGSGDKRSCEIVKEKSIFVAK